MRDTQCCVSGVTKLEVSRLVDLCPMSQVDVLSELQSLNLLGGCTSSFHLATFPLRKVELHGAIEALLPNTFAGSTQLTSLTICGTVSDGYDSLHLPLSMVEVCAMPQQAGPSGGVLGADPSSLRGLTETCVHWLWAVTIL